MSYGCITCGKLVQCEDSECEECFVNSCFNGDYDAFEDAMDDFEVNRRVRIAEANEY